MLKELYFEFEDGRVETKIVHIEENDTLTIYPQRDKIKHSGCKAFKYEVPQHKYLPTSIIRFWDKTMIYPAQIECHPKTTLSDIIEIKSEEQIAIEKAALPKKEPAKKWKFSSVSGGGTYTVTLTPKGLKCDCMGYWRAKDRRCKHIKEVETY